jgi:two-component system nitrogen regulation sensor histidine kinase NtrY
MLKVGLVKYRFILLATLVSICFAFYYFHVFKIDFEEQTEVFQEKFKEQEQHLDAFLLDKTHTLSRLNKFEQSPFFKNNHSFNLHIYRNDSLLFWNTNKLPISRFADIHFPSKGIVHLQNGWYYAKIARYKNYILCASFIIKQDYPYENKDLKNGFVSPLDVEFEASISLEQNNNASIYSLKHAFLFSIVPDETQLASETESQRLLLLLISSIICWIVALYKFPYFQLKNYKWLIPLVLLSLRVLSLQFNWFGFMSETQGFQATLYGTNEYLPNFFEYLLNCLFLVYLTFTFKRFLENRTFSNRWKWPLYCLYLLNPLYWALILYLSKGLIENSSIPLTIERLFSLNFYSILGIISIGALFYSFYILSLELGRLLKRLGIRFITVLIGALFFTGIYFIYENFFGQQLVIAALFPAIYAIIQLSFVYRKGTNLQLASGLTFLVLFAGISAIILSEFNQRKEKSERELFANQLATEQDIATEVEFSMLHTKIESDKIIRNIIHSPGNIKTSDFEAGMERRIFNGFWERYDINFNLFDTCGTSLIDVENVQINEFDDYNEIIQEHGTVTEIDSNLHFISDNTGQYSYIVRLPIQENDSIKAVLYCTLKSKKIPEGIGFPRLLISKKAQVFESLENYSIAKYHNRKLVNHYGKFNFPSSSQPIKTWEKIAPHFYNNDGYNHFVQQKSRRDIIVLSSKNVTWVELITSFSYLFSFYGILLIPFLFQFNYTPFFKRTLSLAVKIQLVLIGLVFVSLLAFGWGSGVFVKNQYSEFTNHVISEKLNSVEIELRGKLGGQNSLTVTRNGNYTEALLTKFSKVFFTDINLYDTHGFMLASSRPKVFNYGLLSEQINPEAYKALKLERKSEYIHDEQIGELNYASAYLPFYSHDGNLLGYINLQHFGQQDEIENQIQQFLVAIINVFMFLLAISIVLAIFISNWVTAPLRLLQENFANIRFGKHNQQISYDKDDEIGALVKNYNQKLDELEFTAQQLAQSERESAWREMAKQVAHEIKNPLTPMKLSIQQLLRVYDPNDPNSEQKVQKVANSIIEQIDALTKIANEFSNFAKMPRPDEVAMDILPVLENVIEVFKEDVNCSFELNKKLDKANVFADKDQMVRTFNNLIKNALQAIPEERQGRIVITVDQLENNVRIRISDNGTGISDDKRMTIFVPYFTTKSNGTGLGLAMVKQIIDNHNGLIYFEANEPEGTTFSVELPIVQG